MNNLTNNQITAILERTIRDEVKKTVNGKIDEMKKILLDHVDEDKKWKKTAQPVIDFYKNMSFVKSTLMSFLVSVGALIGFIAGTLEIIKFFNFLKLFK